MAENVNSDCKFECRSRYFIVLLLRVSIDSVLVVKTDSIELRDINWFRMKTSETRTRPNVSATS